MNNIITLTLLFLFSLSNLAFGKESCELPDSSGRAPASSNTCDTAGELMSLNVAQKDFAPICKQIVNSDPACQKIKPEKRLKCTTKSANLLAFDGSGSDFTNKIFQCVKGFVWDSMVELVKFVGELISTLVGSAVKNKNEIIRFMLDPYYRADVLGKSASKGGKLGSAFLKSTFSYVAREYPKNAIKHPFAPVAALGETLATPLVKFLTEAVQAMVKEYVPQYQCMNGAAKLNTICRIAGEFVMPPAFVFNYLKFGIKGIQALAKSGAVARFTKNFEAMNGFAKAEKVAIVVKGAKKAPKLKPKPIPKPAVVVRAEKAKPITKHTDTELAALARTERAEAKKIAAIEETQKILVEEKFEGKEAFLSFKETTETQRKALDTAYPLETHFDVGLETPHMTYIAEPENLIGKKVVGVESTYTGTYESPMIDAKVRPFEGVVSKIENKGNKLYPDYHATITLKDGKSTSVSLSHSRGLRTPKGTLKGANPFKKAEAVRETARMKATREAFLKENKIETVIPEAYVSSSKVVEDGLASLSSGEKAKILSFRQSLYSMINDNPNFEFLARGDYDRSIRPITELKDEKYRAVVEEAQRLMNDSTSKDGFNNWFIDLMTEVMVDKAKKGNLKWGSKESTLADIHHNFPWGEGAQGLPSKVVKMENFPIITDADLIAVLDMRIKRAGFEQGFKDIKLDVPMAKDTKHLAVLKGDNLDETTPLFIAYTQGNIQFLDDYFVGKPHGVYSHILQNLYMADRFIEPSKNAFGKNMYKQFLEMQTSIVADPVAATRYNDYVGLRSPANPDHVNNMLKLTITDDVKLKYIKGGEVPGPGPTERLAKSAAFKKQHVTVAYADTAHIPVKGELDFRFQDQDQFFNPSTNFDAEITKEAVSVLSKAPSEKTPARIYIVMKPEIGKMTITSPDLAASELKKFQTTLQKSSTFKMLESQPGMKVNRHMKITTGEKPKVEMLRPDEDPFIFQNVHEQTFGAWKTLDNGQDAFPISMLDKRADDLLKNADKEKLVDWNVIEEFEPQAYRTYCGLASVCSVLKREHPELTQEQIMLNNAVLKKPQEVVGLEGMNPGYELDNLAQIAENNGKMALVVRVGDSEVDGVAKLREDIVESLKDPGKKIIANYDGTVLGGKTAGHYSPVAGYDPITDRVLVLDVALHRNESFWVPTKNLYQAMVKKDSYGFARGYLKLDTPVNAMKRLAWKDFDDVMKISGLAEADGKFLRGFLKGAPKDLQERLLIKFQTQSSEATLKDLESMRDLSRINGECR